MINILSSFLKIIYKHWVLLLLSMSIAFCVYLISNYLHSESQNGLVSQLETIIISEPDYIVTRNALKSLSKISDYSSLGKILEAYEKRPELSYDVIISMQTMNINSLDIKKLLQGGGILNALLNKIRKIDFYTYLMYIFLISVFTAILPSILFTVDNIRHGVKISKKEFIRYNYDKSLVVFLTIFVFSLWTYVEPKSYQENISLKESTEQNIFIEQAVINRDVSAIPFLVKMVMNYRGRYTTKIRAKASIAIGKLADKDIKNIGIMKELSKISLHKIRNKEFKNSLIWTFGNIYAKSGNREEEYSSINIEKNNSWDLVLNIDKSNPYVYLNRARYYIKMSNLRQANNLLDEALLIQPDLAEIYYEKSIIQLKEGDYSLSLENLNKSLTLGMDSGEVKCKRGVVNIFLVYNDKAIKDFNECLKSFPNRVSTYRYLGLLYKKVGNNILALQHLSKYIRLSDTSSSDIEVNKLINELRQ